MQNPFLDNMKSFMGNQNMNNMNNAASDFLNKNAETLTAAGQVVGKSMQGFLRKNAEIAQEMNASVSDMFKNMQNQTSPEQLVTRGQEAAKETFENLMSNSREIAESVTKTTMEVFELLSKRMSENLHEYMHHASSCCNQAKSHSHATVNASADKKK